MKRLQSLSYKTLFTILFFSLAGIVFFLKIGGKTQKVSAAWWDDSWHYRKAISITNSSGSNLTDFQVAVSIGTSQLIADGKMQSDCDDIRLTDINGNLLPYWIEENNPGCNQLTDTKIWLKANSLPTSGATVYLYYGNTSANNNENGDNVFEYFDNFNDANKTNSNWTATGTGFTITNGNLYHSTTLEPSNSFSSYTVNNSSSFTNGIIESRLKPASCGSSYGKGLTARYTDDNNQYVAGLEAWTANQTHIGKRVGSGWTNLDQDSLTCDTNTWYSLQWTLNGTNQYLTANGVASSAVDSSFSSGKVGIEIDNRETPVGAYWDYFFVHKYASSDPTPTLQSEELSPAPIAYWKFDEGSGTVANDSVGNNNGKINKATWSNQGKYNKGLNFSPNQEALLLNYKVWKVGQTGSVTGFSQNGSTGENFRVIDTDPFGRKVAVWEAAQNDVASDADGGWNSSNIAIDQTKMYRFSTWIRRTVLGNGTYYIGTYARNSGGTNIPIANRSTGTTTTNAYFRSTSGNEIFSTDSWFLLVAHIWPVNSGTGPAYSDTGLYTASGTKIATPGDFVWQDGTSYTNHRSYLYYSTDPNTKQQWVYPRVDAIDGIEPSIQDLLNGYDSYGSDVSLEIPDPKESFSFWYDKNSTGNWQHIVKSSANYYVNGRLSTPDEYPVYVSGNNIYLGRTTDSDFVTGSIDEFKIYSYPLTTTQIKNDYNSRGSLSGAGVNLGVKSNTSPSIKSSLVAYYKFDENNGTSVYDSSGNNLTGTFGTGNSAPTWTNEGKNNKALSFNGSSSYVTLPNDIISVSNIRTSGITYSAWIKTNNSSTEQRIFGQQISNGYSDYSSGGLGISAGKAVMITYDDSGSYKNTSSTTTIQSNKWYHIVGTYNPSDQKIRIYLNGNLEGIPTSITTFSRLYTNASNRIGLKDNATPYPFNGLIDEVKIYNKALSADEIKQDYNAGSAIQFGATNQTIGGTTTSLNYCIPGDTSYCAAPAAEWNFEENTGTTAKDTSGNNNTGAFGTGNSAPTWTVGAKNKSAGLNFDGKQFITVTDSNILKPTTAMTVESWFNTSDKSSYQKILSKTEGSGYALIINETSSVCGSNSLCFGINFGGTYYGATYSLNNISNNNWYHLTGVYDGNTVKLFLNGINVGTTSIITGSINQGAYNLCIGSETNAGNCSNGGSFFKGKIDGVKIYNYARTPAQVAYDYNRGNPIAWWKLDECQGSTAFDSSGLGNTSVISIGLSGSQTSLGTCQTGTSAAWTNGSSGHTNSSLNFDGSDDYMLIPYSPAWKNKDFTTSFWINPRAYTDIETGYGSHWFYSPEGFGIVGSNTVWINNSSGRQSFSGCNFNNLNKWSHLTLSYNQDTGIGKLYVNSKLNCSINLGPGTAIPWNTSNGIYVGGTNSGSYNGPALIDDIKIFPYTLTDEQVKQVYNGGAINFN